MNRRFHRVALIALAALLLAMPSAAYTIFLTDGSTIIAKGEYRVDGDRALIVLQNGTETFLQLSEIDVEKTKEYNKDNLGSAVLLEGGQIKALTTHQPKQEETLGDLIASGKAETRLRPEARRETTVSTDSSGAQTTVAGYLDLDKLRRRAINDLDFMSELRSYYTSQGLEAQIFQGSQSGRPMVEVVTGSESSVFKSMQVTAQAMTQMRDRYPGPMRHVELLLHTSRGTPAGQFVIDAALAAEILDTSTDLAQVFIEYVQF